MPEIEKNIFRKRKEISLNVIPENLEWSTLQIEKLKFHTEKVKGKYPELEDFKRLAEKVKIEKGEEYAIKDVLISKEKDKERIMSVLTLFLNTSMFPRIF